jgi:protein-L-isoaspartate(D-aspartate) O-methyltransferase
MGLRRGCSDPQTARAEMVERQLRRRGISDVRVLEAMGEVPRERFVPEPDRDRAYADRALPLGYGQTISQPWIVAAICEALQLSGGERVLEVGTGSGYSAAVLARLGAEVLSVERIEPLAARARLTLEELGIANVEVLTADGSGGVAGAGPFDAIAVHAAAPSAPPGLIAELAAGGRLVVPIAEGPADILTLLTRGADDKLSALAIGPSRFVPLIGDEGFDS